MKALYEDVRAIGTPKWVSESGTARVTPRELPFSIGSACSACWEHLPRSSENVCYFLLQIKRLWIGHYDFVSLGMKYSVAVMSHVSLCHAWFRGLWRFCFWVLVTTLSYTLIFFFSRLAMNLLHISTRTVLLASFVLLKHSLREAKFVKKSRDLT